MQKQVCDGRYSVLFNVTGPSGRVPMCRDDFPLSPFPFLMRDLTTSQPAAVAAAPHSPAACLPAPSSLCSFLPLSDADATCLLLSETACGACFAYLCLSPTVSHSPNLASSPSLDMTAPVLTQRRSGLGGPGWSPQLPRSRYFAPASPPHLDGPGT